MNVRGTANDIIAGTSGSKLSLGLILKLLTGSTGMVAVNIAYRVPEQRRWWHRRIVAIALRVSMVLLALIAMTLITAGDALARLVGSIVSANNLLVTTSALVPWTVAGCSMLIGLLVSYWFAPNLSDQGIEAVFAGATVELAGWLIDSAAFRLYLAVFDSFSRTYGSLGAVMVLLLWLYLSAGSILVGGEVKSAIREARRSGS